MDLREIGLEGVDWIRLAQDGDRWRAVVSSVMNLRILAPLSYGVYCCDSRLLQNETTCFNVIYQLNFLYEMEERYSALRSMF
jgi:hypothetical protein